MIIVLSVSIINTFMVKLKEVDPSLGDLFVAMMSGKATTLN